MIKKIIALTVTIAFLQPALATIGGVNTGVTVPDAITNPSPSQGTSQNTSDASTQGTANAQLTTTVVVVGGLILAIGIPLSLVSTSVKNQKVAEMRVIEYMQNNHNELTHDVSIGQGATINQMGYELGLDQAEIRKIEARLSGSEEQKNILKSLNGEIGAENARIFSQSLTRIFFEALGKTRVDSIIRSLFPSGS